MDEPAGHAFISYVREDSDHVDKLEGDLEAAGIPVWRDTARLWPGQDWRTMIRRAITDNALVFIACFSSQSLARKQSYQNEEITVAIEQLRRRQPDDPWLIPIRFDECKVPDIDIGRGRTLSSIQRSDLFGARKEAELKRLLLFIRMLLSQTHPSQGGETATVAADRAALAAAIKAICIKYGFTTADSSSDAKIRRARLEHLPGDGEEIIAFYRWMRFFNEDKGVAFTTWGVRIRRGHSRLDVPYQRIEDYEFKAKTEYDIGGADGVQAWDYFQAGKTGKVEIELPLHGGRGPSPSRIAACIHEIRDLLRREPALMPKPYPR